MKSNPLENIINAIIVITIIGFGVLLLFRPEALDRNVVWSGADNQLLLRSNVFAEYRTKLAEINIDLQFFSSQQFRNLRNDRLFVPELPIGKPDLFEATILPRSF